MGPSDPSHLLRGRIWTGGEPALLEDGVVEHSAGLLTDVRPAASTDPPAELDQHGRPYIFLPGMVDLHNHGGAGHSFPTSDAAGCRAAAHYHRSRGTTTTLASLVSAERTTLVQRGAVLADLADEGVVAGIHLEGPFLNPGRCGAQDPNVLIPADAELLDQIIEPARGHLRSITAAPEAGDFAAVVDRCARHEMVVSLGHSDASAEQTEAALEVAAAAGVTVTATHLFNGMPPVHHRSPGIGGALLHAATRGQVVAELIADGVHLDDRLVEITLAAAPGNVAFVSDAMAAAGVGDGDYTLGSRAVRVDQGMARLQTGDGGIGPVAGGITSVIDQVLRHAGAALTAPGPHSEAQVTQAARAVQAATRTPAEVLGLNDRGALRAGLRADLVALDSTGLVVGVFNQSTKD